MISASKHTYLHPATHEPARPCLHVQGWRLAVGYGALSPTSHRISGRAAPGGAIDSRLLGGAPTRAFVERAGVARKDWAHSLYKLIDRTYRASH